MWDIESNTIPTTVRDLTYICWLVLFMKHSMGTKYMDFNIYKIDDLHH